MNVKANLENIIKSQFNQWVITNNDTIQAIIQRTFIWMWSITAIVFFVGYYMLWLIKSWTISIWQYQTAFWLSAIFWLILVFAISWWWQKMNYSTLSILAILFGICEWIWLSWILSVYSTANIINAFAWASILFISLALYWYFTRTDLTKLWTIFLIWLISIIILSLINVLFIHSSWFDLLLSVIWLLIFLWLVAWNLQILKMMAQTQDKRLEIVFGISLFLDFINIFIYLLRIFWDRR